MSASTIEMQGVAMIEFVGPHERINRNERVPVPRKSVLKFDCDVRFHENSSWELYRHRFAERWLMMSDGLYTFFADKPKNEWEIVTGHWRSIKFKVTDRSVNALGYLLPSDLARMVAGFLHNSNV